MFALIGIPATSAVLFMVAGLLVGYLLWHRDRSADQRALRIAEQKANHARQVARLRKAAFIELRDATAKKGTASNDPQASVDHPAPATALAPPPQENAADLRSELAAQQRAYEQLDAAYHQTQDECQSLRQQLSALQASNLESQKEDQQTIRGFRGQIDQLSEIRDRLATANHELTFQRDTAEELRQAAEQTAQEQRAAANRSKEAAESAQAEQRQLREQLTVAQQEIERQTEEITAFHRLQEEHAGTVDALQRTERELEDIRNINAQLQEAIDEQTAEAEELTQRLAGMAQLEEKLKSTEQQLHSLTAQHAAQAVQIEEQDGAIDLLRRESRLLVTQVETLEPLAARLPLREGEIERLGDSLDRLQRDELQPLKSELATKFSELRQQEETARLQYADLQQKSQAYTDIQSHTQRLEEERNVLQQGNRKLKQRITELTATVGEIKRQLTDAEGHHQKTTAAYRQAIEKLNAQAERINALQQHAERSVAYRKQVALFEAKVRRLTDKLNDLGGDASAEEPLVLNMEDYRRRAEAATGTTGSQPAGHFEGGTDGPQQQDHPAA